jgi:hypothetical protein
VLVLVMKLDFSRLEVFNQGLVEQLLAPWS